MKQIRCSNVCSLCVYSAFLTGRATAGDQPVLSSNRGYWTCLTPLPLSGSTLSSPEGTEFGLKGKGVNKIHTTQNLPHRHKCVCVREGSRHHVCIPALGRDPPPAFLGLRPGPLRNPMSDYGRGGRGRLESRALLHLSVVTLLQRLRSDLVKGESLPTSSLP